MRSRYGESSNSRERRRAETRYISNCSSGSDQTKMNPEAGFHTISINENLLDRSNVPLMSQRVQINQPDPFTPRLALHP